MATLPRRCALAAAMSATQSSMRVSWVKVKATRLPSGLQAKFAMRGALGKPVTGRKGPPAIAWSDSAW